MKAQFLRKEDEYYDEHGVAMVALTDAEVLPDSPFNDLPAPVVRIFVQHRDGGREPRWFAMDQEVLWVHPGSPEWISAVRRTSED